MLFITNLSKKKLSVIPTHLNTHLNTIKTNFTHKNYSIIFIKLILTLKVISEPIRQLLAKDIF